MEAACRGAQSEGGLTRRDPPRRATAPRPTATSTSPIPTGMGEARNALVVRAADAVVAVDGEYGTLSEIALALQAGIPVVGLDTWELARAGVADDAHRGADDRPARTPWSSPWPWRVGAWRGARRRR